MHDFDVFMIAYSVLILFLYYAITAGKWLIFYHDQFDSRSGSTQQSPLAKMAWALWTAALAALCFVL